MEADLEKGKDQQVLTTWTPEEEKALVRKLDWRIMPIVSIMYFMAYLDRVNIGNANVANNDSPADLLQVSLGLEGWQFNWVVAIFFLPYCIFEVPSNFMIKIFGPKLWLARIMISWGFIATFQVFSTNFAGIMVCRTLLGLAEAGLFPGIVYFFSFWYRKHEISGRLSVMFSFNSFAAGFSSLLATALALLNHQGNLKGWQWILVLEGIPSVLVGIAAWIWLPNFPQTSKFFLTPREEEIAIARLPTTAPTVHDKHFDIKDFLEVVMDPILICFVMASFLMILPGYGTVYFRPAILLGIGYTGNMANLMNAWPAILTAIWVIVWGHRSDVKKERGWHIQISLTWGLISTALLLAGQIYLWNAGLRYFFIFLSAFAGPALPILFTYRATTIKGATKQATATGLTIALGNFGGFVAPFIYPNSWAPLYIPAIWISLGCNAAAMVFVAFIQYDEWRRARADPSYAKELASMSEVTVGEAAAGGM